MDNRDRSSTPNNCSHDGSGAQIDHEHIKQPRGDSPSPMPMTLPRVVVVSGKQYTYHELVCPVPRRRTGGGGGGSATVCSGDGSDRAHMNAHGKENALGNHNSNSRDDSAHHHHVLVQMQEAFSADEHLLLQILTHLNPVELSVARQVSRLWRSVADSNTVWRPICTRKWPSWKTQTMKASDRSTLCAYEEASFVVEQPACKLPDSLLPLPCTHSLLKVQTNPSPSLLIVHS